MNLFASFFVAVRRLTAVANRLAGAGESIADDLESRLAPIAPPRLTTGDVDPMADTVDLPAAPAETRRNGKAARR